MRLYIIRHADPDYMNDTLTLEGHREARALAEYLQTLGIDEIYSSPMGRARHTAQYAANLLGLEVHTEAWTRELQGRWFNEFLDPAFYQLKGNRRGWDAIPPNPAAWKPTNPVFAEDIRLIHEGSDDFLSRQGFVRQGPLYRVTIENRKKIAVIAHMGFGLAWLSHMLEIPFPLLWLGFFFPPSSITTVLFDEREPGIAVPRCIGLGDVSHLSIAGLDPKPRGILANYF
jgi:broad specificity phosphatase PhoE